MKKTLAVLGLLLVILLATLFLRLTLLDSKQVQTEPVTDLRIDANAAAGRLAGAVRFPTISHENGENVEAAAFQGLHQYLQRSFPRVHSALTREVVANYSLLYTWKGTRPERPPIVLMSHMDVVPVEPGTEKSWTHPAYSGMVADGFVWGRGTLDDKVGVVAILEAAETLLAGGFQPERTIYFAFGHDEEVGGQQGAKAIAALLERRGVRPELILDEGGVIAEGMVEGIDRPVALVSTAEKGYVSVEMIAESPGGHSSMPPRHTAIGKLAAAIEKLEANPMPARINGATRRSFEFLAPEMPLLPRLMLANLWFSAPLLERQLSADPASDARIRTSTAATIFQAGVKENVLPHQARAVVNFRILPGDSIQGVLRHVRDTVGKDIRVAATGTANTEPSFESDVKSTEFGLIQRTLAETFPNALVAPNLLSGGTDTKHYVRLTRNIYRFLPVRVKAADLARIHGTNERIGVENFGEVVRFCAQLMRNGSRG